MPLNIPAIKSYFPLLTTSPHLAYLDNAATTQTPTPVLTAMDAYYRTYRGNIERGIYDLSTLATEHYENARKHVAQFLNADPKEIIFTSGTTQGLNLLAATLGKNLTPKNSVVLTRYEHHANLIPWQQMSKRYGFSLRFIELTPAYELDLISAKELIDQTTAIVSIASVANSIGTTSPLEQIIAYAKQSGAITIIDAAQSMAHSPLDVKKLDADFVVFSGHKMYGPTGSGILYGKQTRLARLDPVMFGGGMIQEVSYTTATWREAPQRFEAGTPNIAGAIGLGAATDFIQTVGWDHIQTHEQHLIRYFFEHKPEFVEIHGPEYREGRSGVISCSIKDVHPHDIAEILNGEAIAVRAGHHCAMPLMNHLKISGTIRISFGMYTTTDDIDRLFAGFKKVIQLFKK